jgi:hypothetical protein
MIDNKEGTLAQVTTRPTASSETRSTGPRVSESGDPMTHSPPSTATEIRELLVGYTHAMQDLSPRARPRSSKRRSWSSRHCRQAGKDSALPETKEIHLSEMSFADAEAALERCDGAGLRRRTPLPRSRSSCRAGTLPLRRLPRGRPPRCSPVRLRDEFGRFAPTPATPEPSGHVRLDGTQVNPDTLPPSFSRWRSSFRLPSPRRRRSSRPSGSSSSLGDLDRFARRPSCTAPPGSWVPPGVPRRTDSRARGAGTSPGPGPCGSSPADRGAPLRRSRSVTPWLV